MKVHPLAKSEGTEIGRQINPPALTDDAHTALLLRGLVMGFHDCANGSGVKRLLSPELYRYFWPDAAPVSQMGISREVARNCGELVAYDALVYDFNAG